MTAPKKQPGKNGFIYQRQFGIVVHCRDEKHQKAVFTALASKGYKLKVVTV